MKKRVIKKENITNEDLAKLIEKLAISTNAGFSKSATKEELNDAIRSVLVKVELSEERIRGAFKDENISNLSRYGKLNEKADNNYIELNKRLRKVEDKILEK